MQQKEDIWQTNLWMPLDNYSDSSDDSLPKLLPWFAAHHDGMMYHQKKKEKKRAE